MATVIRRSSEIGDPRLPRVPFPEPGIQPTIRLSALAFQGQAGDPVSTVASPEGSYALTTGGQGTPPPYAIHSTGVPAYDFDATLEGATPARRPTLYRGVSDGRAPAKTMIAVVRLLRWPTAAENVASPDRDMHLVRAGLVDSNTLAIVAPSQTANGRKLGMRGALGNWLFGPEFPDDGNLHFVCAVFDGTTGRLYLDGAETTGTINASAGTSFVTGWSQNGGRYELVEAAHYDVALTRAQVREKWEHARAWIGF